MFRLLDAITFSEKKFIAGQNYFQLKQMQVYRCGSPIPAIQFE